MALAPGPFGPPKRRLLGCKKGLPKVIHNFHTRWPNRPEAKTHNRLWYGVGPFSDAQKGSDSMG